MHPIHDVDVILLLAMALAAKRRPAELVEIISAIDMMQGAIPAELKLAEAFSRLASHGLISAEAGCVTLTPAAQTIMAGQPKKADLAERIFVIKEQLTAYNTAEEHATILFTQEQLSAAILAHRIAVKGSGTTVKNLLMPKSPATERNYQRPRQWRRGPAGGGQKAGQKNTRKAGRKP